MKNKKLLTAIMIICVLAISFFGGESKKEGFVSSKESKSDIQTINKEKIPQVEAMEVQTDTEEKKAEEKANTIEKEELKKEQLDKPVKVEKTSKAEAKKKDKYLTDPVPEGKPKPVEWQAVTINTNKKLTCTLSVTCKTILDNIAEFNKDKLEVLPKDGIIYKTKAIAFNDGESVFDVLLSEMKKNKIHMEFEMTPIYNSNYIEGIHNLYEFDCGELSGWMYKVNGWFPNYGCSRYMLKNGDVIEWIYTCDLGRDIGGGLAVGGKK